MPPATACEAVRKARQAGHLVFLCTGRSYGMMSGLLTYGFDGVVASAGAYILAGEKVIYDCPLTEKQKNSAMQVSPKKTGSSAHWNAETGRIQTKGSESSC